VATAQLERKGFDALIALIESHEVHLRDARGQIAVTQWLLRWLNRTVWRSTETFLAPGTAAFMASAIMQWEESRCLAWPISCSVTLISGRGALGNLGFLFFIRFSLRLGELWFFYPLGATRVKAVRRSRCGGGKWELTYERLESTFTAHRRGGVNYEATRKDCARSGTARVLPGQNHFGAILGPNAVAKSDGSSQCITMRILRTSRSTFLSRSLSPGAART
jgi:hypothetical protein